MRRIYYIVLCTIFVLSCKQNADTPELKTEESEQYILEENPIICKEYSKNGIEFIICLKQYAFFILKSIDEITLYRNDNNPSEFVFTDFNEDGFLDIELHFMTNVPGVNEILLFNSELNSFTAIENFASFPASIKIKNTNLYYSYERNGCADADWGSDLYYIEGNKAIRIGNIQTIACGNENENGIRIYKIDGDTEEQIQFIPIKKKNFENKWEFIQKYWTENNPKFE